MAGYSQSIPDWRLMQRANETAQGGQAYADIEKQRQIRSAALQQAATTAPRTSLGVSITPLAKNAPGQTSLAQANADNPQVQSGAAKKPNPVRQIGQSVGTAVVADQAGNYLSNAIDGGSTVATGATEAGLGIGAGAADAGSGMVQVGTNLDGTAMMASSGADAASSTTASTLGNVGSALGVAHGAYQTYDALTDDKLTAEERAFQSQRAAALTGANYFTFGLAGLANSLARANPTTRGWMEGFDELDRKYGALGHVSKLIAPLMGDLPSHKREAADFAQLVQDGVYIPESVLAQAANNKRRSTEDLIVAKDSKGNVPLDFRGYDRDRNWVNNKFAQSRNVADLRAQDIVGYAAFAQRDKDWFRRPLEQQLEIARSALEAGAITEGHGQIGIDDRKWKMPELPPVEQPASEPEKENK